MTARKKWVRPQKGDRNDKRCVNVTKNDEVEHSRITYKEWCYGCDYYVCSACIAATKVVRVSNAHDAIVHQPEEVDVQVN